ISVRGAGMGYSDIGPHAIAASGISAGNSDLVPACISVVGLHLSAGEHTLGHSRNLPDSSCEVFHFDRHIDLSKRGGDPGALGRDPASDRVWGNRRRVGDAKIEREAGLTPPKIAASAVGLG